MSLFYFGVMHIFVLEKDHIMNKNNMQGSFYVVNNGANLFSALNVLHSIIVHNLVYLEHQWG